GRFARTHRLLPPPAPTMLLEEDQEVLPLGAAERDDVDRRLAPPAVRVDPDALAAGRRMPSARLLERGAQRVEEPLAGHLEHVHARIAGRRLEVRPRLAAELHDLQVLIDDDARGRVALLDEPVRLAR